MLNELAGTMFVLPKLIPTSDLRLVIPERDRARRVAPGHRRKSSGTPVDEIERDQKHKEIAAALLWNEPVPILIDKRNEDAVSWHLEPETPRDEARRDRRHGFLWGRRIIVSLPIDEILAASVYRDDLWAVIEDFARKVDADRLRSSRDWRALKQSSLGSVRKRLADIARGAEGSTTWARVLGDAYDKALRHIEAYYATKAGKRRGRRNRGGITDMIGHIAKIQEAFTDRGDEIKRRVAGFREDRVSVSPPCGSEADGEVLGEVVDWLLKNLGNYGLSVKDVRTVVKDMLHDRQQDGRLAEGCELAMIKGGPPE